MTDNTESTAESSRIARRTLLSSLSAGAVALAGCSSNSLPTTTDSQQPSQTEQGTQSITTSENSVFADVQIGTTHVEVELADENSVDRVNLIKPNGELHSRSSVSTGVTQVSLRFSDDWEYTRGGYSPGTYRLIAIAGGESIDEAEIELRPDVSIADVRWAKYHPDIPWDNPGEPPSYLAQIILENTGTGPGLVETLETVDTPYDLGVVNDGVEIRTLKMVPQGGTASLTTRRIFGTGGSGGIELDCEEYETVTFTITAHLRMSDATPTYSQVVRYGTDDRGGCVLSRPSGEEGTTEETRVVE